MDAFNLGKRIQAIRGDKGLSIRKVAGMAGITPSMLSQIESGQVNPSINTLRAIAQTLETPLYAFFKEDQEDNPVVRHEQRRTIGLKSEPDVQYELLTPDTKGGIEFCMMIIPPHLSSYRDSQSHAGEEVAFMYVGEKVELEIEGRTFTLTNGDSVRISPNARHVWHNRSDVTVQVIFAITPPTF